MAVEVHEAVHVHETEVFGLFVARASRGKGLRDERIDLLAALATEGDQDLHCLGRIADGLRGEFTELGVRQKHDGDRLADDDAGTRLAAELGIERVAQCFEKRGRLRQVGDREVEEDLFVHVHEGWMRGTPSTNERGDGGQAHQAMAAANPWPLLGREGRPAVCVNDILRSNRV